MDLCTECNKEIKEPDTWVIQRVYPGRGRELKSFCSAQCREQYSSQWPQK